MSSPDIRVHAEAPLSDLTTLRLGGPARRLVAVGSEDELVATVRELDAAGEPLLVLAGGSNVVVADAGFDGTVVLVRTRGIEVERGGAGGTAGSATLRVAAGEPWDEVVARAVGEGLAGIECLSGIPGSTGATPIQNVGAYGQDVAQTIVAVRVLDRRGGRVERLDAAACGFGYRTSAFKHRDERTVLEVEFALRDAEAEADGVGAPTSEPIAYAELARTLGVEPGERAPLAAVRDAVLALRRGKGMVLDPADPDSVSAGSFFTNPILSAEAFAALERRTAPERPPTFPAPDGHVKTSAAWLIARAGFARGLTRGRVGISAKHTLALVNRGGATTAELVALAREVADGVERELGVALVPEPVFVGHAW